MKVWGGGGGGQQSSSSACGWVLTRQQQVEKVRDRHADTQFVHSHHTHTHLFSLIPTVPDEIISS